MSGRALAVLTRDQTGNQLWQAKLEQLGINTYSLPCIRTSVSELTPAITSALQGLNNFQWLIFTSPAGVKYFSQLLSTLGINLHPINTRVAVIGDSTALAINNIGLEVSFTSSGTAKALAQEIPCSESDSVLLMRSDIAVQAPVTILSKRGAVVTSLPIYKTEPITSQDSRFAGLARENKITHLIFASTSAVEAFLTRVTASNVSALRSVPSIAIGPTVASALARNGFTDIRLAAEPTILSVANLIS